MEADISAQIAELPTFSRVQLLELWQEVYGRSAPSGLRREWMVPFLAYRIQEKAYGGLKPETRAELRRIARSLKKSPESPKPVFRARLKPGTRMVRNWRGKSYEVFVTNSGYEYRGVSYRSLSKVAHKITGSSWSGPAFFGLNRAGKTRE